MKGRIGNPEEQCSEHEVNCKALQSAALEDWFVLFGHSLLLVARTILQDMEPVNG